MNHIFAKKCMKRKQNKSTQFVPFNSKRFSLISWKNDQDKIVFESHSYGSFTAI